MKKIIIAVLVLVFSYVGLDVYKKIQVKKQVNTFISEKKLDGRVSYKKINTNLIKQETKIEGIQVKSIDGIDQQLGDLYIYKVDKDGDFPSYLHAKLDVLDWNSWIKSPDQKMEMLELMKEMDVDVLNGSVELDYKYNQDDKVFELKKIKVSVDKVNTIDLTMKLSDVDLGSKSVSLMMLPLIKIDDIAATYTISEEAKNIMTKKIEKEGMSIDAVKRNLEDVLVKTTSEPLVVDSLNKVINALDYKSIKITASISPDVPMAISELQSYTSKLSPETLGTIAKLLNFKLDITEI